MAVEAAEGVVEVYGLEMVLSEISPPGNALDGFMDQGLVGHLDIGPYKACL